MVRTRGRGPDFSDAEWASDRRSDGGTDDHRAGQAVAPASRSLVPARFTCALVLSRQGGRQDPAIAVSAGWTDGSAERPGVQAAYAVHQRHAG